DDGTHPTDQPADEDEHYRREGEHNLPPRQPADIEQVALHGCGLVRHGPSEVGDRYRWRPMLPDTGIRVHPVPASRPLWPFRYREGRRARTARHRRRAPA